MSGNTATGGGLLLMRGLFLLVLLLNVAISGYHRRRARARETIPRSAEPPALQRARVLFTLPGLLVMLAFVLYPRLVAWATLDVPEWVRWAGVALGLALAPANWWVLATLGANVSETVLTKRSHELVTTGPYRYVRHPLYTTGLLLLAALSLIAANWLLAGLAVAGLWLFLRVIIPREETALAAAFGERYEIYRRQTGRLLPRIGRRAPAA